MHTQITTVSTKGQFVIPSDMRQSLGIEPGTRIAVTLQGSRIILEPVSPDLVRQTRGMLAGSLPSSKALKEFRKKDKW